MTVCYINPFVAEAIGFLVLKHNWIVNTNKKDFVIGSDIKTGVAGEDALATQSIGAINNLALERLMKTAQVIIKAWKEILQTQLRKRLIA